MLTRAERQAEKERTLTVARLRELLHYDPETGVFRWRYSRRGIKAGAIAGRSSGAGYWQLCVDSMYFYAHRLAWLYVTGEWPPCQIDHEDTDKTNNRFRNLRPATRTQNQGNRPTNRNNSSGIKGVRWSPVACKWQARRTQNGKEIHIGYFTERSEAAAAYARSACEYFGNFARSA